MCTTDPRCSFKGFFEWMHTHFNFTKVWKRLFSFVVSDQIKVYLSVSDVAHLVTIHEHESCNISKQHPEFNYTVTTYFEMSHYFLDCNHVPVPNGKLSGNMLAKGSKQMLECDWNHGENVREIRQCTAGDWQPDSTCSPHGELPKFYP